MFRTEISGIETKFSINRQTAILSMGSCFANEIGQRMSDFKFSLQCNPGGILFNPLSIFELLQHALDQTQLPDWTYVRSQGRWFNYKLHSRLNASTREALENEADKLMTSVLNQLQKTDLIIFTFGTSVVYRLRENGQLAANCHKIPQRAFSKEVLGIEEIVRSFHDLKSKIESFRPGIKFLLTVSPVRHVKDGLALNNVSKSTLRLACHELEQADTDVQYFPSYELMMDDLRDYRFYKKDMIHPNEQALDYIWQKFAEAFFDKDTHSFLSEWTKIKSALDHKPFHPASAEHQQFLRATLQKLENLSAQADVTREIALLKAQLNDQ